MADRKITDLTALAAGSQATGDFLTIVDVSEAAAVDKNKKITVESLFQGIPGNVGIGKASSGNKLEIEGQGDTKVVIDGRTDAANGSLATLELWSKNSSGTNNFGFIEYDGDGSFEIGSGGGGAGSVPLVFKTNAVERLRIDSSGNVGIGVTTPGNADEGAGLQVRKYIDRNATYYTPDGHYAGSFGVTNNTQDKVWLSVDSEYAKSSAVSAGLFLSAFHQDAGGSGCGSTIKNLKTDNALTFSTVATASGTGSPAVETERLRIDGSGRLLVGVTTASGSSNAPLQITAASDADALTIFGRSSDDIGEIVYMENDKSTILGEIQYQRTEAIIRHRVGALRFETGGTTERMRIDGSGVIDFTGPGYTPGSNSCFIKQDSSGEGYLFNRGNNDLLFGTNNSERMRIDSSGNVGIGTSSPQKPLNVVAAGTELIRLSQAVDGSTQQEFGIGWASSNTHTHPFAKITAKEFDASDSRGSLLFYTRGSNADSAPNERMRIDRLGNVGIGVSSPAHELHVADVSTPEIVVEDTSNNVKTYLGASDTNGRVGTLSNHDFAIRTNDTERMRIRSDGETQIYDVYTRTDAASPNMVVKSDGSLRRSTSSIKYKTNVETLEDNYADAILNVRPVWYRSLCEGNPQEHSYYGFIAEEVAEIDPRLVHFKTTEVTYNENGSTVTTPCDPEPEGVQYDRFVPHLLNLIKRQQAAIETLETKVAALEAG